MIPVRRQALSDPVGALRQELPVQVRSLADEIPEARPDGFRNRMIFEDVAHRAAKDLGSGSRGGCCPIPAKGFLPVFLPLYLTDLEGPPEFRLTHSVRCCRFGI